MTDRGIVAFLAELFASGADERTVMKEVRNIFESEPRCAPWEVFEAEHGTEIRATMKRNMARNEKGAEQPQSRPCV